MTVAADTYWTPERIKALRKETLRIGQAEFAEAVGYSRAGSVSDLEHGRMEPSDSVCKVLDYIETFGILPSRKG